VQSVRIEFMKFILSRHLVKDKIPLLAKRGFKISLAQIKDTVNNPDHIDSESDVPKIIASKNFDTKLILRVVYKLEDDIIKIITVYPAEKGRYY